MPSLTKALYLLLGGISYTAAGAPGVFRHREKGGGDARPEAAAAVHLYMDTIAHQCSDIIAPSRACRLDQRHRMLAARVGRPTVGQHRVGTAGQLLRVAATTSASL